MKIFITIIVFICSLSALADDFMILKQRNSNNFIKLTCLEYEFNIVKYCDRFEIADYVNGEKNQVYFDGDEMQLQGTLEYEVFGGNAISYLGEDLIEGGAEFAFYPLGLGNIVASSIGMVIWSPIGLPIGLPIIATGAVLFTVGVTPYLFTKDFREVYRDDKEIAKRKFMRKYRRYYIRIRNGLNPKTIEQQLSKRKYTNYLKMLNSLK